MIGKKIREKRTQAGINLKELAQKLYDATAIAEKEHLELIKDMK